MTGDLRKHNLSRIIQEEIETSDKIMISNDLYMRNSLKSHCITNKYK